MSLHHIQAVIAHPFTSRVTKFVAVVMAEQADKHGKCWPSIKTVGQRCMLSERQVRHHMAELRALGIMRATPRFSNHRQSSNLYQFCPLGGEAKKPILYPAVSNRGVRNDTPQTRRTKGCGKQHPPVQDPASIPAVSNRDGDAGNRIQNHSEESVIEPSKEPTPHPQRGLPLASSPDGVLFLKTEVKVEEKNPLTPLPTPIPKPEPPKRIPCPDPVLSGEQVGHLLGHPEDLEATIRHMLSARYKGRPMKDLAVAMRKDYRRYLEQFMDGRLDFYTEFPDMMGMYG